MRERERELYQHLEILSAVTDLAFSYYVQSSTSHVQLNYRKVQLKRYDVEGGVGIVIVLETETNWGAFQRGKLNNNLSRVSIVTKFTTPL